MSFDAFQHRFLSALRAQPFPDYIKTKQSADDVAAEVAGHLTPVIEAALVDGTPPGRSKVGGVPDVPAGFAWPHEHDNVDAPLAFVCQIDLAEVRPHDLDHRLPATGMLWLFSIADGDRAYSYEIDDSTTAVVYARDPGELSPAEPPGIEGEAIDERGLVFGSSFSIGKRFDSAIERAVDAAITSVGGRTGPVRMLGNARFFRQENAGAFDPATDVVLIALDGYAIAQHAFGEGGFTWSVSREQLAAGDLEAASLVFEPGT